MLLLTQPHFIDRVYGGNSVRDYLVCLGFMLAALLLARPFTVWFARFSAGIAKRFSGGKYGKLFRSLILHPLLRLVQVILLYIAVNRLDKPFDWVLVHRKYKKEVIEIRLMDVIDHLFLFFLILFSCLLVSR